MKVSTDLVREGTPKHIKTTPATERITDVQVTLGQGNRSESCDASPDQGQGDQEHISMLKSRCD